MCLVNVRTSAVNWFFLFFFFVLALSIPFFLKYVSCPSVALGAFFFFGGITHRHTTHEFCLCWKTGNAHRDHCMRSKVQMRIAHHWAGAKAFSFFFFPQAAPFFFFCTFEQRTFVSASGKKGPRQRISGEKHSCKWEMADRSAFNVKHGCLVIFVARPFLRKYIMEKKGVFFFCFLS